MVKNSVLTPVLAGVLGLSIVGSGVAYYFTNQDSDGEKDEGGKAKISQVADNINNTLDNAEKAIKGELDFAYTANATLSFGEGFTEVAGMSVQPVTLTTNTKQKGSNTAADFSIAYDGKNLMSANSVYSRDNNSAYIQIPELSDGYLLVNKDSLSSELSAQGLDLDSALSDTEIDFDTDALEKDLEEYEKLIKDTLPAAKDGDKVTGDIDGNKYSYTTKTYDISGNDFVKVAKAVLEKAQNDQTMKDVFNQAGISDEMGMSYDEIVSQYLAALDDYLAASDADFAETITFDAYYDCDDFTGFSVSDKDEGVFMSLYTILDDDIVAIDMNMDLGEDEGKATFKGSAKTVDDVTNGSFAFNLTADGESAEAEISLKDLKEVDDTFSGTIRFDVNVTETDSAVSGWCEIASKSTADKMDLSFEFGMNGKSFMTLALTGNDTEASDITVPSGDKIYDVTDETQLDAYLSSCDTDGFTANIQAALGEELYNMLMSGSSVIEDDYDYGIDYDDDDYDFDDDYDDIDWDDLELNA